jgi:8-oxo-dGTP pyrophosphatase MutT (NUDIX family)
MKRPDYDGVHSGQIAFPGGHFEPNDRDLHQTALREFTEETGAPSNDFEVLGELSRVFIPPSNTLVTPVVAYAKQVDRFAPDPREVAALIDVPVSELMRTDVLKRTTLFIQVLDREAEVPYWDVQGHVVWGATALMIAELRELLRGLGDPA